MKKRFHVELDLDASLPICAMSDESNERTLQHLLRFLQIETDETYSVHNVKVKES